MTSSKAQLHKSSLVCGPHFGINLIDIFKILMFNRETHGNKQSKNIQFNERGCKPIVLHIYRLHMNYFSCMPRSRGGSRGSGPPPLINHKHIGFPSNTAPDPLKNHKATKPEFNVGPSSTGQQNAILMAFCWRADDDQLLVLFGSSLST